MTDFFGDCNLGPNSRHHKLYLNVVLEDSLFLFLEGRRFSDYLDPEVKLLSKDHQEFPSFLESNDQAVLFMLALKDIPTTKFVQGVVNENPHSWVEFESGKERFVADLVLGYPFITTKSIYNASFETTPEWICTHDDFWDFPLTKSIYDRMQKKETSEGLLEFLSEYRRDTGNGFGEVYSEIKEAEAFFPFS